MCTVSLANSSASGPDGHDANLLAASLHAELLSRKLMVGTAESITGGELGVLLTTAPGASESYLGGIVSYATDVKRDVLGVADETIEKHGVVSAACAAEMARGARRVLRADVAISTTGVAGPEEQEGKPVGLVYVAVAGPSGETVRELQLDGDRAEIRHRACIEAILTALPMAVGGLG